jgi:hypothetical protein
MTLLTINSHIRGGGAVGAGAWAARITGAGKSKWPLERDFCRKDRSGTSGSGRSGWIALYLDEPGIYELRGIGNFQGGSVASQERDGGGWSGFIKVDADGNYEILGGEEMSPQEILALVDGGAA